MKKLMLILVVLVMSAPLYAAGTITFSEDAGTISYVATGVAPVAMGLNVTVDGGEDPVTSVSILQDFFEIYMDAAYSIESDPCDPCSYQYGDGTPIADPCAAGEIDLGSNGMFFCISMGGLGGETDPEEKEPLMSGDIIKLSTTVGTTGQITLNNIRGGVIGSDGEPMTVIGLPLDFTAGPDECMASTNPDYADWTTLAGSPECWCYCKHCNGDADGCSQFSGQVPVYLLDLNIFLPAFGNPAIATTPGDPGWCGDFARDAAFSGQVRVYTTDLARFLPMFGAPNASVAVSSGPGCSGPHIPPFVPSPPGCDINPLPNTEYNFWVSPTAGCGANVVTPCP